MRLSEPKIRFLTEKLARWLGSRDDIRLAKGEETIALEMAKVIRDELRLEDELDEKVEEVIRSHQREIDSSTMDLPLLRQKIKRQLAKEQGIIL